MHRYKIFLFIFYLFFPSTYSFPREKKYHEEIENLLDRYGIEDPTLLTMWKTPLKESPELRKLLLEKKYRVMRSAVQLEHRKLEKDLVKYLVRQANSKITIHPLIHKWRNKTNSQKQ